MELVLLVIQVILALLIIGVVLIQRSDNDGFGLGSGGGGGLISARGQANLLTRTTAILAFLFMANSLLLTIITTQTGSSRLIDDVVKESETFSVPKDGAAKQQQQQPLIEDNTGTVTEEIDTPALNKEVPVIPQEQPATDNNLQPETEDNDAAAPSSDTAPEPITEEPVETEQQDGFTAPKAD